MLFTLLALMVLVATPAAVLSPTIPEWCAITLPNGVDPEHVEPPDAGVGQEGLYVGVPTNGIYYVKSEPDSEGGWNKHIWARDKGQEPVTITVEPVGDHTPMKPDHAKIPLNTYAGFIWFPEEGCYKITGTTPQITITVIVWVVFVDAWLATPPA